MFCNTFFDAAANSFEQCRNIEKIIWRCNTNFIRKFVQISRKSEFCFARQSGKHYDPRSGEIQGQIMKDAVRLAVAHHKLFEPLRGAANHVREISSRQANSFGLAGSAGCIDDGH